ncbi:hypothetical protein MASR2M48_13530 [Spirochaetota bacterium]
MLLPDTDAGTATRIAERIRRHVEELGFDYEGPSITITLSLRVAGSTTPIVT